MFDEHTWQYKNIPSAVVLTLGNKVILCALTEEGVLLYIHEESCQMCTCLITTVFDPVWWAERYKIKLLTNQPSLAYILTRALSGQLTPIGQSRLDDDEKEEAGETTGVDGPRPGACGEDGQPTPAPPQTFYGDDEGEPFELLTADARTGSSENDRGWW